MCHYPVDHAEPIQNSKKYVKGRSKNFEKYSLLFVFFILEKWQYKQASSILKIGIKLVNGYYLLL